VKRRLFTLIGTSVLALAAALIGASPASAAHTTTAGVFCTQANHGGNPLLGSVELCGWIRQIRDDTTNQVRGTVGYFQATDQGGNVQAIQINRVAEGVSGGPAFSGQVNETPTHADVSGCVNCSVTMKSATSGLWANTVGVYDNIGGGVVAPANVSIRWADGQLGTYNVGSNISFTYRCAGDPDSLQDCGSSSFSISP
jgi:hypothetical protein